MENEGGHIVISKSVKAVHQLTSTCMINIGNEVAHRMTRVELCTLSLWVGWKSLTMITHAAQCMDWKNSVPERNHQKLSTSKRDEIRQSIQNSQKGLSQKILFNRVGKVGVVTGLPFNLEFNEFQNSKKTRCINAGVDQKQHI